MNNTRLRQVIAAVLIGSICLVAIVVLPLPATGLGNTDLLAYWSAARLLESGHNLYSRAELAEVSHMADNQRYADPAWNPPWLMLVLMPLSLLPYEMAVRVWLVFNLGALGILPILVWRSLAGKTGINAPVWLPLVGMAWLASLVTISIGQVVTIVLLGLVLCVIWLRNGHPGWAGAALVLTLAKPHLIYLVVPVILIWAAAHRRWRVWGGLGLALVVALAVPTLFYPAWPAAYLNLVINYDFFQHLSATLGGAAQAYLNIGMVRYVAVFTLLLLPWLVRLCDRRDIWTGVNVALLISLPLAPFGWSFDQIMLIPAVVQIVFWLHAPAYSRVQRAVCAIGLVAIYLVALIMKAGRVGDVVLVWVPLALSGMYVLALPKRVELPAYDDEQAVAFGRQL